MGAHVGGVSGTATPRRWSRRGPIGCFLPVAAPTAVVGAGGLGSRTGRATMWVTGRGWKALLYPLHNFRHVPFLQRTILEFDIVCFVCFVRFVCVLCVFLKNVFFYYVSCEFDRFHWSMLIFASCVILRPAARFYRGVSPVGAARVNRTFFGVLNLVQSCRVSFQLLPASPPPPAL